MKGKKCLLLLLLGACLLGGCSLRQSLCRYVTRVDIYCDHRDTPIVRSYTKEDKMGAVLMYLRLLHLGSAPETDPDTISAESYQIDLTLSDGSHRVYIQKDHRYIREPDIGWQSISPEQAAKLYAIMRHFESDA